MTWNYDYADEVLAWILQQERCDKGTAARVFLVEGMAYWLFDAAKNADLANDETNVCRIVLKNWHRYRTSEFNHNYEVSEEMLNNVLGMRTEDYLVDTPLEEIMTYQGKHDAVSDYESSDGRIVVSMNVWMKSKGIEIS